MQIRLDISVKQDGKGAEDTVARLQQVKEAAESLGRSLKQMVTDLREVPKQASSLRAIAGAGAESAKMLGGMATAASKLNTALGGINQKADLAGTAFGLIALESKDATRHMNDLWTVLYAVSPLLKSTANNGDKAALALEAMGKKAEAHLHTLTAYAAAVERAALGIGKLSGNRDIMRDARQTVKAAEKDAANHSIFQQKRTTDETQREVIKRVRAQVEAARTLSKHLEDIEGKSQRVRIRQIAEGVRAERALRKQLGDTGSGSGGSGAPGAYAGIGVLNYFAKLPGGSFLGPLGALTGALGNVGKAALGIGAAVAVFEAFRGAINLAWEAGTRLASLFVSLTLEGLNYNAMLTTSQAGMAAIVSSFSDITDAQGKVIEGSKRFDVAMNVSSAMQKQLQAEAIQTAATYEELVRAMQEAAGPAFAKGFSPGQLTTFTVDVAKTAQAIGLPFDQLNQEVRGLLEGDMSKNSRVARLLLSDLAIEAKKTGTTVEKELKRMAKSGELFTYLHDRMKEFTRAAEVAANTLPTRLSNLKDAFQQALGMATASSVDSVTGKIKLLTDAIVTFDNLGNAHFNENFVGGLRVMSKVVADVFSDIVGLIGKVNDLYISLKAFKSLSLSEQIDTATGGGIGMVGRFAKSPLGRAARIVPGVGTMLTTMGALDTVREMNPQQQGPLITAQQRAEARIRQQSIDEAARVRNAYVSTGANIERAGGFMGPGGMAKLSYGAGNRLQLQGMKREDYLAEIGKFRKENSADKVEALMRNISKHAKDGVLTVDEFKDALMSASYGAEVMGKSVDSAGEKTKDMTSKVGASVNSLEALAEQMRQLAESSDNMLASLDADLLASQRGIETGLLERQAADLQRQVAAIEANVDDEGNLSSAQMQQISNFKLLIVERNREISLAKERYALQEKQLKLEEASEKLDALREKRHKIELDLVQAQEKLSKLGGKGTDNQRADAAAAVAALEDQRDRTMENERRIASEIVDLRVSTTVESNLAIAAINADADAKRVEEEAATAKKIAKNDAKAVKETEARWAKTLKAIRKQWEEMGKAIGDAINRGLKGMISGEGDFGDAFREFAGSIVDGVVNTLTDSLATAMKDIFSYANMSPADQEKYRAANGGKGPMGLSSGGSKGLAAGIAGVAGAYQLSQIGGSTRGQNIMAGVATGAATGAQIGSLATQVGGQIWGAVIGAVVGAIIGYMAPTADKIGMRFTNRNGILWVQGLGDAKDYQVTDALNQLNRSIAQTRAGMLDIFLNLPTAVLTSMMSGLTGFRMPEFNEIIDPVTSAGDKIKNFLTVEVPKLVMEQYIPALGEVASLLGVSEDQVKKFKAYVATLDVSDAQAFVAKYFEQLATLGEIAKFGAMSLEARSQYAERLASKTPVDRMADINAKIGAVLPSNYRDLSLEEQTQINDKLMPLIKERYQLEIDYLNEIRTTMEANLKSIDDQIFGLQMEDMSPQEQMDAILAKARDVKDQIRLAATPAEVARLSQEYQNLIGQAVQIGGNRPEDRANAIAGLTDLREIVAARYEELRAAVEEQAKPYFDLINQILTGLRDGIAAIVRPPGNGSGGNKPPGGTPPVITPVDPNNPNGFENPDDDPLYHWRVTINGTSSSIGGLSDAADLAARAWKVMADVASNNPPASGGDKSASSASTVNVYVEGEIAPLVTRIRSEVVSEAVEQSARKSAVIRRRASRF